MFKKPSALKAASPLRSSARRAFVSHLQRLYPILAHATSEQLLQVVPGTIKQCGATTSGGLKAIIYTDEGGTPLWFELGHDAGQALLQSQQQRKKNGGPEKKGERLAEVIPTVYAVWLMPELLPRLPTWPQIVDPTLLSGSALMIPGLIPLPNTFPDAMQWTTVHQEQHQSALPRPAKSTLVSITPYPSAVPMLIARLEADIDDLIIKRNVGEKGKAATPIHCMGDALWALGNKQDAPDEKEAEARSISVRALGQGEEGAKDASLHDLDAGLRAVEISTCGEGINGTPAAPSRPDSSEGKATFSEKDVDQILYLALLTALADAVKRPDALPMSISTLYSSYVLPNRPSHWPPMDVKGRKEIRLPEHLAPKPEGRSEAIDADAIDVRRSSAKKVAKWMKAAEKTGVLKTKEVKGKDTVVVSVNLSHDDLRALDVYKTISQAQRENIMGGADFHEKDREHRSNASGAASSSTTDKMVVVIERFWRASNSSVKLFQEMGCSTALPLSRPVIRKQVLRYIAYKKLVDPQNQSMVRIEDPHLTHALFPKISLDAIPPCMRREEIVDRLLSISCDEYHRTSRLHAIRAAKLTELNTKSNGEAEGDAVEAVLLTKEADESFGQMTKGAAQPITVDVKKRQGRKLVSLVTNLEMYGIEAEPFAADLMRIVGASASASEVPSSTAKHRRYEVFVQGDQRKAIVELLEAHHGMNKSHVRINDGSKN